jgi:hypothetical protein
MIWGRPPAGCAAAGGVTVLREAIISMRVVPLRSGGDLGQARTGSRTGSRMEAGTVSSLAIHEVEWLRCTGAAFRCLPNIRTCPAVRGPTASQERPLEEGA